MSKSTLSHLKILLCIFPLICHHKSPNVYFALAIMHCFSFLHCRKGSDRMKFLCYSTFGWGMPLLMGILTAVFDSNPNWGIQRPEMGDSSCFLSMSGARFYFYMPILFLLCFNTLMYLVTVYSLWKAKKAGKKAAVSRVRSGQITIRRNSAKLQRSKANSLVSEAVSIRSLQSATISTSRPASSTRSSNRSQQSISTNDTREQLVLFTKLFLIMGLSWLSECIHIELHGDHQNMEYCNFYLEVFLRVLGGLNMIRGFFIFMVFICKPKIWDLASKRHPRLWKYLKCCCVCNACQYEAGPEEQVSKNGLFLTFLTSKFKSHYQFTGELQV